ncbi:MAG: aryl-alcohol dehydrogenase-like predicted oxidoreductase [Saprospiraceae bacterium]|jgi:aryl-alcohol dehydrogenase-like predicted oxidoreductase|tara:strand:- start:1574 stop:2566 length:993 start_codon:yes stop_codon:yes gene_type:complete
MIAKLSTEKEEMMINNKIGLGTAAIGRPLYINIKEESTSSDFSIESFREKGIQMLETAYQLGMRYFDTAPGYGIAESILIDWVAQKVDGTIEVATKWGYTYVADFDPEADVHEVKEHSVGKLNSQWNVSKELLPYLTSYQIHSATIETGVLDNVAILGRLSELKRQYGLLIGITTTGANQVEVLKKALAIQVDGEDLFDLFQVTYNVFDQSIAPLAEEISKGNKRLVIKEALANGRVFPNEKYPHYHETYQYIEDLSVKYNVGVDAIGLRFCMDSIPMFSLLSGASIEHHLSDNLKANGFRLLDLEIDAIKAFAVDPAEYWDERSQLGWG